MADNILWHLDSWKWDSPDLYVSLCAHSVHETKHLSVFHYISQILEFIFGGTLFSWVEIAIFILVYLVLEII